MLINHSPKADERAVIKGDKYRCVQIGKIYNGSLLMYKGIKMDYRLFDFETIVMTFESV